MNQSAKIDISKQLMESLRTSLKQEREKLVGESERMRERVAEIDALMESPIWNNQPWQLAE